MDDISMMDTTSDDELDFNTPLWKRIGRRHDSSYSMTAISGSAKDGKDLLFGKPYFETTSDALKTAGSSSATDAIAFGERGSPLSEVTSNISRSPPFSCKLTLDKGSPFVRSADCKVKVSANSGGTSDSKTDSCRAQKQESKRYPLPSKEGLSKTETALVNDALDQKSNVQPRSRSSCMFSTERTETSGKQLSAESSSTLSGNPVKGGWRRLSPTESSKKFLNSPPFTRRHSGQSSPKSNSVGSSVHIHWDKNKQMQSTSLESRIFSSPYSPNKHTTNFSPKSNHSSPSLFGIRSPILIPDTPELSGRCDMINESDSGSKKSSQDLSYMKRHRDNVLLNDLLSEGELDSSKDFLSSSSSGTHLLSSVSPSSRHKNTSSDRSFLSPSKKFKDYLLQKQKGCSERKVCKGKDPVWDFTDEMLSSPEKCSPDFSRKFDYRKQKNGAFSRDNTSLNKTVSPDKDPRSRHQCTSTTSEDDDLPLISLISGKHKSKTDAHPESSAYSAKIKPDTMAASPSRPWSSPPKKRPWGSPSRIKPATVVISPWRPQTDSSCGMSSRMDTWNKDRQNRESASKNSAKSLSKEDTEDEISCRRATLAKVKKGKMKSLLAVFSSDEDEDVHPYADKKRKIKDDATGMEWMDETAKRRKTNSPSSTKDSQKHESSVYSKRKDSSSLPIRVNDLGGISPDKKDRSSLFGHHKMGGRNIPSTRAYISGRIKDTSRSSSASTASSLLYPNHGSTPTAATSSKTSASLSNETFCGHASSGESVHLKNSKGKGKKRRKSPIDYSPPSIEAHRSTSGRDPSPDASDLPSSSGISVDTVTTVKDDSDDEVVMLDSFSYASSLVGSYGKKRKSHKKTEAKASSKGPSSSGATGSLDDERNTVSPSILQQLNQMDADEAMARKLQEEFDAEMARSVQQHGPPHRSTEDTNLQTESVACSSERGTDQPDAGTFGNFNPRHNISIEVSSDIPVQIGSFNWNYGFQHASAVLDRPGRPPLPPSPPSMHRRGRPNSRQRRSRRRNSDDRQDEDIPDLANPARNNRHRPDMEMIWNLHHDLFPGRDIRWMPYPDYEHINTPPRPGRQQGRGRGRARGRRRDVLAHENDGNDYDALLQLADSLGPAVDKRLTQSSIDRLPTFKFTKGQHSGSEEENSCPICMDDYEEGAELRRLPCFHGYHKQCIDVWLKKNQDPVCPICRVEVRIE